MVRIADWKRKRQIKKIKQGERKKKKWKNAIQNKYFFFFNKVENTNFRLKEMITWRRRRKRRRSRQRKKIKKKITAKEGQNMKHDGFKKKNEA